MSKGMVVIRWLFRHLNADKADNGRGCIGQVIKCICHDRDAVYQYPNHQLGCKQKKVAENPHPACKGAILCPDLVFLHLFMILNKMFYQKISHINSPYSTFSRNSPSGGAVNPAACRSSALRTDLMSSGLRLPCPTSISVPARIRTICCKNPFPVNDI